MSDILFYTSRLRVRRFTPKDSSNFFLLNGDELVMRYIRPVKTLEDSDALLQETLQYYSGSANYGAFAIEDIEQDKFAGLLMFKPTYPEPGSAEIGYAFIPSFWNKGYATEIVQGIVAYGKSTCAIKNFIAKADPSNTASIRVLHKNGFIYKETLRLSDQISAVYWKEIDDGV